MKYCMLLLAILECTDYAMLHDVVTGLLFGAIQLVEHAAKFYLKTELLKAFFAPLQENICGKTSHGI